MDVFIAKITEMGGMLVGAFVLAGITYGIKYIRAKTNNESLTSYLDLLSEVTSDSVLAALQTTVAGVKESGGKLDQATAVRIKSEVVNNIKKQLPNHALDFLTKADIDVDARISALIEADLLTEKQANKLKGM